jgi:hypothetical protein
MTSRHLAMLAIFWSVAIGQLLFAVFGMRTGHMRVWKRNVDRETSPRAFRFCIGYFCFAALVCFVLPLWLLLR